MRVLVTGSTGFVGSHTVGPLLDRGHDVRLLVRDEAKAARMLALKGVAPDRVELHRGDMLDLDAVKTALAGAGAVVHAAAAIGVTSGGQVSVHEQNVSGTRNVVGTAADMGLDPIVHVSTIAVFIPPAEPVIRADSPLGTPSAEYGTSKLEAERMVRGLQDGGQPITIVYPGGVLGPDQPSLDTALEGIVGARSQGWPVVRGGVGIIDVRDLGEALAACVAPGQGARRFLLGGTFLTWGEFGSLIDDLTGVRARRIRLPGPLLMGLAGLLDLLRRVRPIAYPLTRDAAEFMVTMVPTDDQPTWDALALTPRDVRVTVEDALRWLAADGHLEPRYAGKLAPGAGPA